ncbi:winged helix DNA-binding domain-containing protein [Actinoallomurus rhizosphaericola]|uniref:winged helix DNA-binding domain-containing protein n=1 Tax=Actinoallomurus rhizosphaericola TaxID=2952536 RepID=UPI00209376DF|nr:winged helix DNA-binding domain-containing protein [Actinoallomurus rhizosphaericola]MCO5998106.1 winged helix DNA-binding domain-containing protein [Actinoallomurus rhizosphaericola]
MTVRAIKSEERRARLGARHHLADPADTAVDVARALVALHGTDPASVHLAAAARMRVPDVGAVERALYDDRLLLRMLAMRRTVFTVPAESAPIVQAACSDEVARRERRKTVRYIEEAGLGDDAWLREVEEATVAALRARGEAFTPDLSADVPRLKERIVLSEGKAYEARPTIANRVLLVLAAEGRIIRGRPRGSWTSSQFSWSPAEAWWPGGLPRVPAEEARAELIRRWLGAYGPGTAADLKWWTGLTLTQVRRALELIAVERVELDGEDGYVLAEDVEPGPDPGHWVALLPALDPTVMGWAGRDWYLGEHGPLLFDRNGNAGPTVWCDGRAVGGWAQRADGEVVCRLLEDVGTEAAAAIAAEAARLTSWLGPVRLAPRARGRSPIEAELVA